MRRVLRSVWRCLSRAAMPVAVCGLLALPGVAAAQRTWYVDDNAPADPGPGNPVVSDPLEDGSAAHPFDAIQKAVDPALNGETVLVLPGTYKGVGNRNITFFGYQVILRSRDGAATCIMDVQSQGRGFDLSSGEPGGTRIEGLTIRGASGGGIYILGSSCEIVGCRLTANNAPGLVIGESAAVAVRDCLIDGNSTVFDGGGVRVDSLAFAIISRCVIRNNTAARDGGGVSAQSSWVYLFNSVLTDNVAGGTVFGGGGAIFYRSDGTLTGSLVAGNRTNARDGGGVMINADSNVLMTGATVVQNRAARTGGGLYAAVTADSTVANSILWSNTPQSVAQAMPAIPVRYCDVQGGWPGAGNLNTDPAFVDFDGPDGSATTVADNDYRLAEASVCRDAGDNGAIGPDFGDLDGDGDDGEPVPVDLDEEPRRSSGGAGPGGGLGEPPLVDLGAFEAAVECAADLNGDGAVDFGDYLEFLNLFDILDPRVDFNGDGVVDFGDYLEFLNLYDAGC